MRSSYPASLYSVNVNVYGFNGPEIDSPYYPSECRLKYESDIQHLIYIHYLNQFLVPWGKR